MSFYLLLPKMKIHNANALSSPYTIGFPAMTAWLGGVHALQRKIRQAGFEDVKLNKTGVVCHEFNLQTYRGKGDYVNSIIGTGNPLDKDGGRPSFIEEARCHLTVSLLIECEGISAFNHENIIDTIPALLTTMKMAGGDILDFDTPEMPRLDDGDNRKRMLRRLMPGYAIVERRELMAEAMENGADAIEALLDYLSIKHRSETDEEGDVSWHSKRKIPGWIVPVATGFHGISDLTEEGTTANTRDNETPHRFAESVVTLGEFIMPYRLGSLNDLMWQYEYEEENSLYLCKNV